MPRFTERFCRNSVNTYPGGESGCGNSFINQCACR